MGGFNSAKGMESLIKVVKWWLVSFIAILISNYLETYLLITNPFLEILFASLIISIIIQAVRSHDHEFSFRMRWFIFYFLIYAIVIFMIESYIINIMFSQGVFFPSLIVGFVISVLIRVIEIVGIRSRTVPWISFILILVLVVANLNNLSIIFSTSLPNIQNNKDISENKQTCPSLIIPSGASTEKFSPSFLIKLIDTSVWRVENEFSTCYQGKYSGQHLDRFYCDDLIVSRFDTSSSGSINYRWYITASAEFSVDNIGEKTIYSIRGLSCENGKKVTLNKKNRDYYVHYARDGTPIRVEY